VTGPVVPLGALNQVGVETAAYAGETGTAVSASMTIMNAVNIL
jgi:hypothetical protein